GNREGASRSLPEAPPGCAGLLGLQFSSRCMPWVRVPLARVAITREPVRPYGTGDAPRCVARRDGAAAPARPDPPLCACRPGLPGCVEEGSRRGIPALACR